VQVSLRSAGETWIARVTQGAVRDLELTPGGRAFLVIKAHAVHPHA
jgi:ABC-type molybdate transport system ATPase subunit